MEKTKTANAAAQGGHGADEPAKGRASSGAGVEEKTQGAWNVDPDLVAIRPGFNIRIDMGDLDELAAQIRAKLERDPHSGGLIHALGVKRLAKDDPLSEGGKFLFEAVRGARRTTAIRALRKKGVRFPHGVPATLLDKAMDVQTATIEMFVENTGKPLLPIEQAYGFRRLRDGDPANGVPGMTLRQIEKATGFSDNTINAALALLEADEEVVDAVASGKVSASVGKDISVHARGDKARQKELVREAVAARGDKAAMKRARGSIRAAQTAKHARKGRSLKIRALDDAELSNLGSSVAGRMVQLLSDAGKEPSFDMEAWIAQDDKLALAASYGALQALKAAAGVKTSLEF